MRSSFSILLLLLGNHVIPGSSWKRQNNAIQSFSRFSRGGSSNTTSVSQQLTTDDDDDDGWRDSLPSELKNKKGALNRFLMPTGIPFENSFSDLDSGKENVCEVYLLGTAHVSKDSCEDVKLLMKHVRPDVLFIELCNQRTNLLEDSEVPDQIPHQQQKQQQNIPNNNKTGKKETNTGVSKAAVMSSGLLSKIQNDYASKLNVTVGGEFREAFICARDQHKEFIGLMQTLNWEQRFLGGVNDVTLQKARYSNGCSIVLGDRPVRLTLLRAWEALNLFGKLKLVLALIWSSFRQPSEEELKEWIESIMNDPSNDILSKSMEELGKHFPAIKKVIIEERDTYMSCKIVQTARILGAGSSQDKKRRKIVAIVGAGHCPGMNKILTSELGNQGSLNVESELVKVIETKKHKVEGDVEMKLLTTDVMSIEALA